MSVSAIFPFYVCNRIIEKRTENRKLKIRKGDMIEVPPFVYEPIPNYLDMKNTINTSIQIKKTYTDIASNLSYECKTLNEKSILPNHYR